MKNLTSISILLIIALLTSCVSKEKKEKTISISGAFALYPFVVKWADEYRKENPEIRFNISGGGAGKGMADALNQTVDLGMFSREISQEEIAKGVWWVGLTIDAVIPTVSASNPDIEKLKERGITKDEFEKIFIKNEITYWDEITSTSEKRKIVVYTRSDACGAAGTWAKYLNGTQEMIKGIGIYGDPGLAEAVSKDPSGIGFNNTIFVYDIKSGKKREGIEVIPIDQDNDHKISEEEKVYDSFDGILKAIAAGKYPSPPARELFFVSKGKPEKQAVIDFIKWVLTTGQKYVKESGYVTLEQKAIDEYLEKLK